MLDLAKAWYPLYVTADQLKDWVLVGYLSQVDFKTVTGQDYTGAGA